MQVGTLILPALISNWKCSAWYSHYPYSMPFQGTRDYNFLHITICWSKACRSTYSALCSYRPCVQFGQIQRHKNREGNWWNSQTRAFALLLWRCPTKCHCISAGSCRIPIHPAMEHNLVSKAMETNVHVLPWSLQRWTLSLKMIISCLQSHHCLLWSSTAATDWNCNIENKEHM
jgi:hypothetical protein